MKKKILITMLILSMAFTAVACGDKRESTTNTSSTATDNGVDDTAATTNEVSESDSDEGAEVLEFRCHELDDGSVGVLGFKGDAENVVIPAEVDGKIVTQIGARCSDGGERGMINNRDMKSLTIPDTVIEITSSSILNNKSLESLDLGHGVQIISKYACSSNESLTEVVIPASVTTIMECAFCMDDNLSTITFEAEVENIDAGAFVFLADEVTVYGPAGGNVEAMAKNRGYNFVAQ